MGAVTDAIEKLKPLADSRGFEIGLVSVDGDTSILVTRIRGKGSRYFGFCTTIQAALFLKEEPELPRFKVRATFATGDQVELEYHDSNTPAVLVRAARDAAQTRPGYRIKSLEVL
jgi:hypothetical protein